MKVKVGFTPGEELTAPVGVVIDVLRATSVITQAFAAGYKSVTCTGEIEDARELAADEWGVKLAGERHNVKIEGFDFKPDRVVGLKALEGNSQAAYDVAAPQPTFNFETDMEFLQALPLEIGRAHV